MGAEYTGNALGTFEIDSLVSCYVALDVAAKTANIKIKSVERNRLGCEVCAKIQGNISDVNAAMDAIIEVTKTYGKLLAWNIIPAPGDGVVEVMQMTVSD